MRLVPAAAIAAQILLGNLCYMPLAFADEAIPMDHDMQEMEQIMEMAMTPVSAMSPLHCKEGCVMVLRPAHHFPVMESGRMPCNDGHCLSEHIPALATVTQLSQKDIVVTAIPVSVSYDEPLNDVARFGWSDHSRKQISSIQTIVLRE